MNTITLYEFSAAQLKLTNRKEAAAEANTTPAYVSAMTRAGFTESRLISAAQILDWRLKHPKFCRDSAPPSKRKKRKTKKGGSKMNR